MPDSAESRWREDRSSFAELLLLSIVRRWANCKRSNDVESNKKVEAYLVEMDMNKKIM